MSFTITFDQFNASLMNKSINFFSKRFFEIFLKTQIKQVEPIDCKN